MFPMGSFNLVTVDARSLNVSISEIEFESERNYAIQSSSSTDVGLITLVGPSTVTVGGEGWRPLSSYNPGDLSVPVIATDIGGTNGLTKDGHGLLKLTGTLSYSGTTTVRDGVLISRLTPPSTLELNGGAWAPLEGKALDILQPIVVGSNGGTMLASTFSKLSILGGISGTSTLLFENSHPTDSDSFAVKSLVALDGVVDIRAMTTISGTGALSNNTSIVLRQSLVLDNNSGGSFADRIGDNSSLHLRGGTFSIRGSAVSAGVERLGQLSVEDGLNNLWPDDFARMRVAGLDRSAGGILSVNAGTEGTSIGIEGPPPNLSGLGAPGTPDVGIISWARQSGIVTTTSWGTATPVTVADGYLRPLTNAEFVTTLPVGTTNWNLRLDSSTAVSNPVTVNSLTITNGTVNGVGTITVSSGALFIANNLSTIVVAVPIDVGAAEAVLHAPDILGAIPNIDSPISGSGGLVVGGIMRLGGMSTYTGQTIVTGGLLKLTNDILVGQPNPFGMDSSPILFESANVQISVGNEPLHFDRDITVNGGRLFPSSTGSGADILVTGDIALNGPLEISGFLSNNWIELSGTITGPGSILKSTRETNLRLLGENNFAGGFRFQGGNLEIGNDSALGTGIFDFNKGSISAVGGARTISNNVVISAIAVTGVPAIGGANPLTFTGIINLDGRAQTLAISNSAPTTFQGPVVNGELTKTGTGLLIMRNVRLGALSVGSGTLQVIPSGTDSGNSRVNALTIAPGAAFDLTNTDLIVDYSGTSPASTIQQYLSTLRLFSSIAIPNVTTLGYGQNSVLGYTTFSGQPVDSTALLIKYTYFGDANLDGMVNLYDLVMLANGWQSTGPWTSGDFNYDGIVNSTDLGLLAMNWQAGNNAPLGPALEELGLPPAPIPEPVVGLTLSLIFLPRRRILHTIAA